MCRPGTGKRFVISTKRLDVKCKKKVRSALIWVLYLAQGALYWGGAISPRCGSIRARALAISPRCGSIRRANRCVGGVAPSQKNNYSKLP